jgi:hypothetical protein
MAKDLVVGSAGLQGFEGSVSTFLSSRGLEVELAPWLESPDTIAELSCFNGASIMEFLRHAVHLEGFADENEGFAAGADGKLSNKNFPWWDNSLWLPLGFNDPGGLDDDPTFFIGSCQSLLAELNELKQASPLQLGEVVAGYSDMRSDFVKFVRSDHELNLTTEDCVRWIWRALRDGVELAIAKNTVLWLGPD